MVCKVIAACSASLSDMSIILTMWYVNMMFRASVAGFASRYYIN
ncbi:hypothetical protein [Clostridioides sp. ZZV15-6388]